MTSLNSLLGSQSLPLMHLRISECIFTRRPCMVTTVLGSCISVTFFHAESGMAAICHAMLPELGPGYKSTVVTGVGACRFVDVAISTILRRFKQCGIAPASLDAKLFGGACNLLQQASRQTAHQVDSCAYWNLNIGTRNVDVARKVLAQAGVSIKREHVGGSSGRKLFFHTASGDVWLKTLQQAP